ncbi:MAG: NAD-dependent epimerase/dehydratase family protein [archaeon]|nr:NAD-dependent epimerase/dehydratase family protein [archaeon]
MDLNGKRILVTGANSFLGKSLVPSLKDRDLEVITFGSKEYNLKKEEEVKSLFENVRPEVVIHMAVDNGGIEYTKNNCGSIFYNNLIMNTLVQEYSKSCGVEKFIGIGTAASYPKDAKSPLKEDYLWNGLPDEIHSSIGVSKRIMLFQSKIYREQYGFNSINLLLPNLYGPDYSMDAKSMRIIPLLIKKIFEGKKEGKNEIMLSGTPDSFMEFLYVEDCSEAVIKATELYGKSDPVNIGSGKDAKIRNLAEKVKEVVGFHGEIIWKSPNYVDERPRRVMDVSKAEKEFGFKAMTSLDEGLRKTVEWYSKNFYK